MANHMKVPNALAVAEILPFRSPLPDSAPSQERPEWNRLRKLARHQLERLLLLVPEVLRDDDRTSVHELRVTCRRIEQMLDLLYPKFPPRHIRKLHRNVKRCRRAVGEIRDCDVYLSFVEGAMARSTSREKGAWQAVREYLRSRRARKIDGVFQKISRIKLAPAYIELRRDLDSARSRLNRTLQHEASERGDDWVSKPAHPPVEHALAKSWRTLEAAVEESRAEPSEAVIHGVRIATKRLRYLVEIIEKFDVPGSSQVLAWLRTLQQAIGAWHDLEGLEQMMTKMLSHEEWRRDRPEVIRQIEKLLVENRELKRTSQAKFAWMMHNSKEYRVTRKWVLGIVRPRAVKA